MNSLSSCHPAVAALYFLSVLILTMFSSNPLLLATALTGGILFFAMSQKHVKFFRELGFYLVIFAVITLTNPLFSHNGITTLFFLNGNPVTLEAIFYGMNIAVMLIAVMYWFKCFNLVLTEDKILYLMGKISPKISLIISSALRLIPLFKNQAKKIRQIQKTMGLYSSDTWTDRLRGTARVVSSLITWALENAIDTGSAMKARGYGLKGRSHYSLYRFGKGDGVMLGIIAVLDGIVISALATGRLDFAFYPRITVPTADFYTVTAVVSFFLLAFLPFILEVKESLLWKFYKSKI